MVVRIDYAVKVALIVVNSHTDVALERIATVDERTHIYSQRLHGVERLAIGILNGERPALIEHQLWRRLQ